LVFSFDTGTVPHRCQLFCTVGIDIGKVSTVGKESGTVLIILFFSACPLQDFKPVISVSVAGGKTRLVPLQVEYTLRSTFSTRGIIFYKIQDSINQAVKVLVVYPVPNADVSVLRN
jgi:hypothetical protein